jgi:hypothetical protein
MSENGKGSQLFKDHAIRIAFYALFAVFIAAVTLVQMWWDTRRMTNPNFSLIAPAVTSAADSTVEVFLAMTNLTTSFSTGILGALGLLLINMQKPKKGQTISPMAKFFASGSAFFATISMILGYVVYQEAISLLQLGMFRVDVPLLSWARYAQFFTFLPALLFFGDFAIQSLGMEGASEAKSESTANSTTPLANPASAGIEPRSA